MLCHVFLISQRSQEDLRTGYLNPSLSAVFASQCPWHLFLNRTPLHRVFVCRTHAISSLNSRDALRKKTSQPRIRTEMLDGLGRCRGNHQGLSYVPEIIRIELTSHFGIEKSSRTRCQEILWRPAVVPNTYSSSEEHQLRFDSRHRRSAYENDTLQAVAYTD